MTFYGLNINFKKKISKTFFNLTFLLINFSNHTSLPPTSSNVTSTLTFIATSAAIWLLLLHDCHFDSDNPSPRISYSYISQTLSPIFLEVTLTPTTSIDIVSVDTATLQPLHPLAPLFSFRVHYTTLPCYTKHHLHSFYDDPCPSTHF